MPRNTQARNNSPAGRWGNPPGTPTGVYQWQETPGTIGRVAHDWTARPTVLNHFAMGCNRFGNLNQSVFVDQGWPQLEGPVRSRRVYRYSTNRELTSIAICVVASGMASTA